MLTIHRRLDAGPIVRHGSVAPYRSIAEFEGEPHSTRSELIGAAGAELRRGGRALACVAQLTDLHMTDVESPVRFEFVNGDHADPRFRELLPMQRPQEALNAHALDAMVRTINGIEGGPVTGAPLELVVMTGDAVDNAQENELNLFIDLFDGGYANPKSGGPEYEGVQAPSWPGDIYWRPDGVAHGQDLFASAYSFPRVPGLLERALQPFQAGGVRLPWIGCHGNHEELCQGVGMVTAKIEAALAATRKPFRLPDLFERDAALETFVKRPEAFLGGPSIDVPADRSRRPFRRDSFVDAHFRFGARPRGHGFTSQNQEDRTAYYVFDTPAVRFITLDTACPAGGADGCIGADQIRWLERRLEEVHSKFQSRHGLGVTTSHRDRLVVILSHHGLDSLSNQRARPGAEGSAYVAADDLPALLHRFGNVVLWLNGHIHANRVRPRPDPRGVTGGFWEVTTASLVDWPCQGRLVEVVDSGDGTVAIACTMVDHDGAIAAGDPEPEDLAGRHRELAGNAPFAGFASGRAGGPQDRNVILPLRAPFALRRLHSE